MFTLEIYSSLHIALERELKAFYDYISKGLVESSFTEDLEKSIVELKTNKMQEKHYMSMADTILESREEGIEIGREETKLETAKNLLEMGLSLEQISQATTLPLETIQKLAQEVLATTTK